MCVGPEREIREKVGQYSVEKSKSGLYGNLLSLCVCLSHLRFLFILWLA